jgi:hypothetical protein
MKGQNPATKELGKLYFRTASLDLIYRALVLANSRDDVTIDNILSHPVGPISVSMFHEDGTTRKSCKSNLVKQFEKIGL